MVLGLFECSTYFPLNDPWYVHIATLWDKALRSACNSRASYISTFRVLALLVENCFKQTLFQRRNLHGRACERAAGDLRMIACSSLLLLDGFALLLAPIGPYISFETNQFIITTVWYLLLLVSRRGLAILQIPKTTPTQAGASTLLINRKMLI